MANNIIRRVWNQNRMVNIEDLTGAAFQAESGGHTFEISGIDDTGAVVELSGTVSGVFRRPDNADIALTGSASDGVVSFTLSEDCYAVPGRFGLTIFATSNSQKVAVYACVGTVAVSSTGNVAGDTPGNVEDLLDAIDAAIADLNSAIGQIPANYANVMAAIAPTYSGSALYPVGAYAWYNGSLYRCTTAITTAETWTAAHWTAAVLAVDAVKVQSSALPNNTNLNDVANNTFVMGASGNTYINTPTEIGTSAFTMETTLTGGVKIQTLYLNDGSNIFRRRKVNTNPWSSWTSLFSGVNAVKVQYDSLPNNTNLDDVENNTFVMGAYGSTYINTPNEIGVSAFTLETTLTAGVKIQTLYLNDGSNIFRRRKVSTNPWSSWTSLLSDYETKERELRILAIGNSYTRDNLSYVPFIVNNVDPTINLTLGISYASGATLAQYVGWFTNDTATLTYNLKKPGTSAWEAQQTSKTLKYILDDQPWDIILFQQSSSSVEDYSSISGYLGTLINDVVEYVGLAHGSVEGHTVKLGFLFPQLRRSVETPSSFYNICSNMQKILDDFAIDFIVPCGTAIQNARNTTLNNYGASGGMCYDSNGHLQEGIGCLCGAYTATLKLLEEAYRGKRSVLGDNTRPNAAWVTSHNIPEPNPSSPTDADVVGVTNANCLIAQKCAVQAIKKPYIVSPIS